MATKTLLAAAAALGLGFLLAQPAHSITAMNLDQGARTASTQSDVVQVAEKKKKAKKKKSKKGKKGGDKKTD